MSRKLCSNLLTAKIYIALKEASFITTAKVCFTQTIKLFSICPPHPKLLAPHQHTRPNSRLIKLTFHAFTHLPIKLPRCDFRCWICTILLLFLFFPLVNLHALAVKLLSANERFFRQSAYKIWSSLVYIVKPKLFEVVKFLPKYNLRWLHVNYYY